MGHAIYRVTACEKVGPFTLRVEFDDSSVQVIDFRPVLKGEIYGALRDASLFDQVTIDEEVHTLVWPNGADFDPAMLHDWTRSGPELARLAQNWPENPTSHVADGGSAT
ncbi:MAG: DUF2442 domain-containing protein [Candidatus Binatia bacterium]